MLITRHHLNQTIPVDQSQPFDAAIGHREMPNQLLLEPGFYKGFSFDKATGVMTYRALDMRAPGLYQIFVPLDEIGPAGVTGSSANIYYRIVASTAEALASAVAWLSPFGVAHTDLPVQARINMMMNSPVSLQCGDSTDVLIALARASGYEARYVACYTTGEPNGYNDGHTCAEIKVDGRWVMFDSSLNFVVADGCCKQMSMYEVCRAVREGVCQFTEIAPFQYDGHATTMGKWNPWGWAMAHALHDDTQRAQAATRLYQIPLVYDGQFYFCHLPPGAEHQRSRVEQIGYKVIDEAEFVARFYPYLAK